MTDHYYSSNPTVAHDEKKFRFQLRGRELSFNTDAGVFSKERIDYGSVFLIETMQIGEADHVLDMGCGYGPIGISAAFLAREGNVLMVDVNERAVSLAKQNIKMNGIQNAKVMVSNLFEQVDPQLHFDVILTNPPIRAGKQTVHQILEDAYSHLKPGGQLWVVIQKKQGAPSALKKMEEVFRSATKVAQDKGYWIIRAEKNASI